MIPKLESAIIVMTAVILKTSTSTDISAHLAVNISPDKSDEMRIMTQMIPIVTRALAIAIIDCFLAEDMEDISVLLFISMVPKRSITGYAEDLPFDLRNVVMTAAAKWLGEQGDEARQAFDRMAEKCRKQWQDTQEVQAVLQDCREVIDKINDEEQW